MRIPIAIKLFIPNGENVENSVSNIDRHGRPLFSVEGSCSPLIPIN